MTLPKICRYCNHYEVVDGLVFCTLGYCDLQDCKGDGFELEDDIKVLQSDRDNSQPLTLEQLKERDGKPIYITVPGRADLDAWHFIVKDDELGLVAKDSLGIYANGRLQGCHYDIENGNNYGKTWLAYDYEPKKQVNS